MNVISGPAGALVGSAQRVSLEWALTQLGSEAGVDAA
jgi:hypothetical protein